MYTTILPFFPRFQTHISNNPLAIQHWSLLLAIVSSASKAHAVGSTHTLHPCQHCYSIHISIRTPLGSQGHSLADIYCQVILINWYLVPLLFFLVDNVRYKDIHTLYPLYIQLSHFQVPDDGVKPFGTAT